MTVQTPDNCLGSLRASRRGCGTFLCLLTSPRHTPGPTPRSLPTPPLSSAAFAHTATQSPLQTAPTAPSRAKRTFPARHCPGHRGTLVSTSENIPRHCQCSWGRGRGGHWLSPSPTEPPPRVRTPPTLSLPLISVPEESRSLTQSLSPLGPLRTPAVLGQAPDQALCRRHRPVRSITYGPRLGNPGGPRVLHTTV